MYTVLKSTLLSESDSLFEELLANDDTPRDSQNRLFIDRDGLLFRFVLDYLRNKSEFVVPDRADEKIRLKNEANFFKLKNLSKLLESTSLSLGIDNYGSNNNKRLFGCIVVGYRGTFLNGRDGLSDIKFRKISRILICGRVNLCREVFGETLNESRDPDHSSGDRYTARYFLKHTFLEQAFDTLIEADFELKAAAGTSALSLIDPKDAKCSQDAEENRWLHYNEFVFVRHK